MQKRSYPHPPRRELGRDCMSVTPLLITFSRTERALGAVPPKGRPIFFGCLPRRDFVLETSPHGRYDEGDDSFSSVFFSC